MSRIVVVYHSASGRTRELALAVVRGATDVSNVSARAIDVAAAPGAADELAAADAIVFGCPTYMGSASAAFKAFMDSTAAVWAVQGWRDKLAAGFTHSAAPSGDKLGTLLQLATFAAQHGMIWVGLGLPPSYAASGARDAERDDTNRLGSHLGAMAQSVPGSGARPSEGDLATCEHLGRRVAEHAIRWSTGRQAVRASSTRNDLPVARHPTTSEWALPPLGRKAPQGLKRTNLRELAARRGRFEHHLTVVARVGDAQLEIATASEPLYFAHVNVSDEYAIALPTGDDMVDRFPLRTFLTDPDTAEDVGRYNHRVGDLVLHPYGLMHWPGRLRPPYEPLPIPKDMLRCGLSLVFCASKPTPAEERPLIVSTGREADAKSYAAASPPMLLFDALRDGQRAVARVGSATLGLMVRPGRLRTDRGAYVVVLQAGDKSAWHACDIVYVPAAVTLDCAGIERALVLESDTALAAPPPESWETLPSPAFAPFDRASELPLSIHGIRASDADPTTVLISIGDTKARVPRYWLARMLFRIGLHPSLGYVETYGGFFYDDRGERAVIGLRGAGRGVSLSQKEALEAVEALYRAVAPEGYSER